MMTLLIIIGVCAGILGGIFGLGGGIIIVPSLIQFAKMQPQEAVGTSLAAMVVPLGAAVGAYNYYRTGHLTPKYALMIAIGMAAGAFIGSWIATNVDGDALRKAFALLMVAMAVKLWFG